MAETPKEKVLEKIVSKLKENVTHSEEFLNSEALDPVNKKIDNLIQNIHGLIEKNAIDQDTKGSLSFILNGLENMRDSYTYYMNAAVRATNDYNTYVYVLEALYNEYSNSISEPAKIVKEAHAERKVSNQAPTTTPTPQPQAQPKAKEPPVVVETTTDEKPKEKSGRFKFSFP